MIRRCIPPIALALAVIIGAGASTAASQPSPLVPGGGSVAGRGYGQWVVAAWRWRLSLPGVTSNRTSCLAAGQHGPVWFLNESNTKASAITITCAIPAGRYLMLSVPSNYCSTLDFPGTSNAGLMRCARRGWNRSPGSETVTLDGAKLSPPGYAGETSAFAFRMRAQNNWLDRPGRTHGRMAIYGAATIIQPVSPGAHTLVQILRFAHSATFTNTYQLTIG
jgi:hypothetical protein